MFLLSDPLKKKLKRAKRIKKQRDKLFWKKVEEKGKETKRILTFVTNDICPECGELVKLEQTKTDSHYKCTKCAFEIHFYDLFINNDSYVFRSI